MISHWENIIYQHRFARRLQTAPFIAKLALACVATKWVYRAPGEASYIALPGVTN